MRINETHINLTPDNNNHTLVVRQYGQLVDYQQKIYIQASLHADELPGGLMIYYLEKLLRQTPAETFNGNITIVPHANPIGAHQFLYYYHIGRYEMGGAGNFNRHHLDYTAAIAKRIADKLGDDADRNRQIIVAEYRLYLDEQLADPTLDLAQLQRLHLFGLAIDADIVLDCHCDSVAVPYLYTSHHAYPALEDLARWMGAEQIFLANVSGGNSFDEAFSRPWWELAAIFADKFPITHRCQSTTLEYRGQADVSSAIGKLDADNMYNFLVHRGFIKGTRRDAPPLLNPATDLRGHVIVKSPLMGIVVYEKSIGVFVKMGDVIAKVIDQIHHHEVDITSPIDGYFYAHPISHWVRRGDDIASIGGRGIIKSDSDYLLND